MAPNIITVLAMINNMVGGSALVIPLLFVQSGFITSIILTVLSGIYSYYSCYICYIHISKKQKNYKESIQRHINNKFPLYDIMCFFSDEIVFYLYFNMIVKQWSGIFYDNKKILQIIPILTWISLVFWNTYMKQIRFGVKLMAYGIISIFMYSIFILWMFLTRNQEQKTENTFQLIKFNVGPLLGTMASALSIQTVFVSLLKQNNVSKSPTKLIFFAYLIGVIVYIFIGVFGGFGLLNRKPISSEKAQTVLQYFYPNKWQTLIIEIIYLIHLYSVWPEWGMINKTRLINLLKIKDKQIYTNIYFVLNPTIGLIIFIYQINITTLLEIKGGICLFFIIYAIPIYIHVKCKFYHKAKVIMENSRISIKYQQLPSQQHMDIKQIHQDQDLQECDIGRIQNTRNRIWQGLFLLSMTIFGIVILLWTIYDHAIGKI